MSRILLIAILFSLLQCTVSYRVRGASIVEDIQNTQKSQALILFRVYYYEKTELLFKDPVDTFRKSDNFHLKELRDDGTFAKVPYEDVDYFFNGNLVGIQLKHPDRKYFIDRIDVFRGGFRRTITDLYFPVDKAESQKMIPLTAKAGELKWINFYGLKAEKASASDPLNGTVSSYMSFIIPLPNYSSGTKIRFSKDHSEIKSADKKIREEFYGDSDFDPVSLEKQALLDFLKKVQSGYWKEKAVSRLNELSL